MEQPEKHWKFSLDDVRERQKWGSYMRAYEDMIRNTATDYAPWYVVPADHKWFTRLVVVGAMIEALDDLDLKIPKLSAEQQTALQAARGQLEGEQH